MMAFQKRVESPAKGILMQAKDLDAYLKSLVQVPEKTVDRIIIGSPETEIIKIGTAWMPYWDTCREAVEQGTNVLVVHEPTFYTHWDRDGEALYPETIAEKQRWIEAAGLVIIRCHDVLDKIQTPFGIPFAFGRGLGFSDNDILRASTYYNVYRCPPTPALAIARRIAGNLKAINQPGVGFYGDGTRIIESIGLGTGMICNPIEFASLKPDLFVVINDAIQTWTQGEFSHDTGQPMVVIDHGASEEFGVRALHDHLVNTFPQIEIIHFQQGCSYQWITAS
jgi:putative NIF3 family GTP cyclohydrolase 1 type 2